MVMQMQEPHILARRILDIIPPTMHQIRLEMRSSNPLNLTIPQFRVLANVFRGKNLVGEIARHHGVSAPAVSRMVSTLADRGLVERVSGRGDRRRIILRLTPEGTSLYHRVKRSAQFSLSGRVAALSPRERDDLRRGLDRLEQLFVQKRPRDGGPRRGGAGGKR